MNKLITLIILLTITSVSLVVAIDFTGKYCELDGAQTENGERVTGECFMYSDKYGEIDGA